MKYCLLCSPSVALFARHSVDIKYIKKKVSQKLGQKCKRMIMSFYLHKKPNQMLQKNGRIFVKEFFFSLVKFPQFFIRNSFFVNPLDKVNVGHWYVYVYMREIYFICIFSKAKKGSSILILAFFPPAKWNFLN